MKGRYYFAGKKVEGDKGIDLSTRNVCLYWRHFALFYPIVHASSTSNRLARSFILQLYFSQFENEMLSYLKILLVTVIPTHLAHS